MSKFVLGKFYSVTGETKFICGGPIGPTFDSDVERAAKFDSIKDALLHRSALPQVLGGTAKYRVHEVLPDGSIRDVEG